MVKNFYKNVVNKKVRESNGAPKMQSFRLPLICAALFFASVNNVRREAKQIIHSMVTSTAVSLTNYLSPIADPDDFDKAAVCIYSKDIGEFVKKNREIPPEIQSKAACRVLVKNSPDFHYEVLESVMLKFPLPWDDLDCDFSKSNIVIFDLGLKNNSTRGPGDTGEVHDYMDYWRTYVQGNVRQRMVAEIKRNVTDGSHRNMKDGYEDVKVFAGDVDWYVSESIKHRTYAAKIETSCGSTDGKIWTKEDHHYCVQHIACEFQDSFCNNVSRARSCWLNPMHNDTCYFMPDVFPMFPESQCEHRHYLSADGKPKLRLCTVGGAKLHFVLAEALAANKSYYKDTVEVYVHQRGPDMHLACKHHLLEDLTNVVFTKSYVLFEQSISRCHILLPLMDPVGHDGPRSNGYFPFERRFRKLSGSLSQLVGYSLPTVIHEDLYGAYKDVIRHNATTYNNQESFVQALNSMIEMLRDSYQAEIEQACANPMVVRGKKCLASSTLPPHANAKHKVGTALVP